MFGFICSSTGYEAIAKLDALDKSLATIEFRLDGTILTANANFLRALGFSLEDIRGKHHSMFVEPAYRESAEYRQFWARLNHGEYQAGQFKRIRRPQSHRTVRVLPKPDIPCATDTTDTLP